ncbi:MAG: hypothetical protein NT062_32650, partial [Proteobacteria bacterium]|nr:hypothetical protein [Pseudomonadota bacterium]
MRKLVILPLLLGACWTAKSEGVALRTDVTSLKTRLDQKEKDLETQVAKLKTVIEDATAVLKRNNAGLGADVDQLRGEVRTANGLVVAVNTAVTDLKSAYDAY